MPQHIYRIVDGESIFGPLMRGFLVTIEISVISLFFTIVIGLVTALFRMSQSFAAQILARVYLEIIRNTPLLVQLYLFYFVLSPIIDVDRYWIAVFLPGVLRRLVRVRDISRWNTVGQPGAVGSG